jgi:5,6-dimethylbenzimidazole synthase
MKRFDKNAQKILLDILSARRDVRGNLFDGNAPSNKEIDTIIKAALKAPSVGYSQPWKFVIIKDKSIQSKVYDIYQKSYKKSKKHFKTRPKYYSLKLEALQEAPIHIAVFYHNTHEKILGQTSQDDVGRYSVAMAIQNMWLMARSMDIGIGWVSIINPKKVRKLLNLGKAYELVGYLCVGKVTEFLPQPELKLKKWQKTKPKKDTIIIKDNQHKIGSTKHIHTITGDKKLLKSLIDKPADFMLMMSYSKTATIEGITQAGLKGLMHLTPVLDSEYLKYGKLKTIKKLPKTASGIPTPALITKAIDMLKPFGKKSFIDLGLPTPAKIKSKNYHKIDIPPSDKLDIGSGIDAWDVFSRGIKFAKEYRLKSPYLIIAESIPSGTTSAQATALALGYEANGLFSSSFANNPTDIKTRIISQALTKAKDKTDIFDKLSICSDNMLLFTAGFVSEINSKYPIILAGGTQMACVLMIVNSISKYMGVEFDSSKLILATTKWVAQDTKSDIKALLNMLDFKIDSFYSDFDFSLSYNPKLKLYDKGEAKEGVGAGGALVYGYLNGLNKTEITNQIQGAFR